MQMSDNIRSINKPPLVNLNNNRDETPPPRQNSSYFKSTSGDKIHIDTQKSPQHTYDNKKFSKFNINIDEYQTNDEYINNLRSFSPASQQYKINGINRNNLLNTNKKDIQTIQALNTASSLPLINSSNQQKPKFSNTNLTVPKIDETFQYVSMLNKAELALCNNEIEKDILGKKILQEESSKFSALNYAHELSDKQNLSKNQASKLELNFNELKTQKEELDDKFYKNSIENEYLKNECFKKSNDLVMSKHDMNLLSNELQKDKMNIDVMNKNLGILKINEMQLKNKNTDLEFDISKKNAEIEISDKKSKLQEQELFQGVNVTIKEKEDAINYLKNKLSLSESQVINFLNELNNMQSNMRNVSQSYENEIEKIIRKSNINEMDKDMLINDLNNRIMYLKKSLENQKEENAEKSKQINELETNIKDTKNYLDELNKLNASQDRKLNEQTLKQKNELIEKTKEQNDNLLKLKEKMLIQNDRLEFLTKLNAKLVKERDEIEKLYNEKQLESNELNNKLSNNSNEFEKYNKNIEFLKNNVTELNNENDNKNKALDEQSNIIEELKKDLKNSCNCFDQMKNELQNEICQIKLKSEQEINEKIDELKNEINELNQKFSQEKIKQENDIKSLYDKYNDAIKEIEKLENQIVNLKMQLADVLTKQNNSEKENDNLRNEIQRLNLYDSDKSKLHNDECNKLIMEMAAKDAENNKKMNDMQLHLDRQELKQEQVMDENLKFRNDIQNPPINTQINNNKQNQKNADNLEEKEKIFDWVVESEKKNNYTEDNCQKYKQNIKLEETRLKNDINKSINSIDQNINNNDIIYNEQKENTVQSNDSELNDKDDYELRMEYEQQLNNILNKQSIK